MSHLGDAVGRLERGARDPRIEAPEDWSQGRTLFGGMTAALCYQALERAFGP